MVEEQSSIENKWKIIDSVKTEIDMILKLQNQGEENSMKFLEINQKINRIQALKNQVDKDENELKMEYVLLMRERNVYFEKLKMIQSLGDNNNWNDDSGLLNAVRNLLSNLGDKQEQSVRNENI